MNYVFLKLWFSLKSPKLIPTNINKTTVYLQFCISFSTLYLHLYFTPVFSDLYVNIQAARLHLWNEREKDREREGETLNIRLYLCNNCNYICFEQICRCAPLCEAQWWPGSEPDDPGGPVCDGRVQGCGTLLWTEWRVQFCLQEKYKCLQQTWKVQFKIWFKLAIIIYFYKCQNLWNEMLWIFIW